MRMMFNWMQIFKIDIILEQIDVFIEKIDAIIENVDEFTDYSFQWYKNYIISIIKTKDITDTK